MTQYTGSPAQSSLTSVDPATGISSETGILPSTAEEVTAAVTSAAVAAPSLARKPRTWRAGLLRGFSESLEQDRDRLVSTAEGETGLGRPRLNAELTRCQAQFRLFADAVEEGSFLEAAIDTAAEGPLGAVPEVRRLLIPLGPVAVFGSSNFPFAFSVLGGDTASALAAGNPVVIKAHSSHPMTSQLSFDALARVAQEAAAPVGTLGIVYGQSAGVQLVTEPDVRAVAFTGSLGVAQILLASINARPEPIPFYGELSSINPLIVTENAIAERSQSIAEGLATSVITSGGQLCTKPGVAFVPAGSTGDAFIDQLKALFTQSSPQVALSARVLDTYNAARTSLAAQPGVTVIAEVDLGDQVGHWTSPTVLQVAAADITRSTVEEAFGPLIIAIRYGSQSELREALQAVPKSLTATVHSARADEDMIVGMIDLLESRAGRIVFDGFPTGVRVSWAQHHGGPWPATNSIHTAVGVTSMRRFLRPVAYQNAPQAVLPSELRDGYASIPRRLDGRLHLGQ